MRWVIEWEAYCEGPEYSTCEADTIGEAEEIARQEQARARYGTVKVLSLIDWFDRERVDTLIRRLSSPPTGSPSAQPPAVA
jgi:hypothetical protein